MVCFTKKCLEVASVVMTAVKRNSKGLSIDNFSEPTNLLQ